MVRFCLICTGVLFFGITSANAQESNWNLTSLSKNELCRPTLASGVASESHARTYFPKTHLYISEIFLKKGFKYVDERNGCKSYSISFRIDTGRTRQIGQKKVSEPSYINGSISVNLFGENLNVFDNSKKYRVYYVNLYHNQITRAVAPFESEDEALYLLMQDLICIFMRNWNEDHKN